MVSVTTHFSLYSHLIRTFSDGVRGTVSCQKTQLEMKKIIQSVWYDKSGFTLSVFVVSDLENVFVNIRDRLSYVNMKLKKEGTIEENVMLLK